MAKHDDEFTYDVSEDGATQDETSGSGRSKIISATMTSILVAAGLAGGAAFAISRLPHDEAPIVSAGSAQTIANSATSAQTPTPAATPTAEAAKTIVVPPASFDDKGGERNFHEQPAGSAAQASTSATAAPLASTPPSFGNGDGNEREGDGGERHHKDFGGLKPGRPGHDNQGGFATPGADSSDD